MGQIWQLLRGWADERVGGMTDSQIARALEVQPQLVGKWKTGAVPSPANLARVARVTGLDYEHVLVPAVVHDLGYLPVEKVMGNAKHPAAIAPDDPDAELLALLPPEQRAEILAVRDEYRRRIVQVQKSADVARRNTP